MMNWFYYLKARLQFDKAVKLAEKAHAADGERYYVMPTSGGKLVVVDRKNFRILKRKHYIPEKATQQNLVDECFYCTTYADGTGNLPDFIMKIKNDQYYAWFDYIRKKQHEDNKK